MIEMGVELVESISMSYPIGFFFEIRTNENWWIQANEDAFRHIHNRVVSEYQDYMYLHRQWSAYMRIPERSPHTLRDVIGREWM